MIAATMQYILSLKNKHYKPLWLDVVYDAIYHITSHNSCCS